MAESEKLWDFTRLETAMDDFWLSFFVKERGLRSFAVAQTSNFPQSFVDAFITGLNRVRWRESNDPDYVIARKIMCRVALLKSDPAEYVSSIFGLEKKSKRIQDKERKKEKKKSLTIPEAIWDQEAIESSISKFWDDFFLVKLDIRSFAQTHSADFPERLDELRWSVSKDPEYKVASAVMKRLASPTPELEGDMEAKFLAERMEEEKAQRRQSEREERRQRKEAERKEKREKKKTQAAFNKSEKERKERATKLNQQKRVGGRAIGL